MGGKVRDTLRSHLQQLSVPNDAAAWLIGVWDVFQGLDDWVDGTPTDRASQDRTVWNACFGLAANPFFAQNSSYLLPLLANVVLKWQASDFVERNGEKDQLPKAYVWRAGYYDLVLQVLLIVHGVETAQKLAPVVMRMYGERYEDYVKEFDGA